jgi:hypothetical protein
MKFQNLEFGTSPVFLHSHGWGPHAEKTKMFHVFNRIKQKLLSEPSEKIGSIPDLTIITFNNKKKIYPLEECLVHFGVPYIVLGKKIKKFKPKDKINLILNALKNIKTKYVSAIDAKDVLALNKIDKTLETFKKEFKCKILFQASKYHYPKDLDTKEFEESVATTDFKFLNGGLMIGEKRFCKKIYKEALETSLKDKQNSNSEQRILKKLYKKNHPEFQIDHKCRIFQSFKRIDVGFYKDIVYTQILKGWPYLINLACSKILLLKDNIFK